MHLVVRFVVRVVDHIAVLGRGTLQVCSSKSKSSMVKSQRAKTFESLRF